jgi:hypothetical protein
MTRWVRNSVLDEYAEAGEGVVLLSDGRVLALSPASWALIDELGSGVRDELELADALVSRFGRPYDDRGKDLTQHLVQELLDVLADQGLLSPEPTDGPG